MSQDKFSSNTDKSTTSEDLNKAIDTEQVVAEALEENNVDDHLTCTAEEGELAVHPLTGMYRNWFLDYASYVILERAVPHLGDGLKPVQRRILHTMKRMDDGRYNKVANIAGETMKFHPHGDASIVDALTQMGRQNLLIDCQGSWGNILTGDEAAAARYIEGRLTKFALDVMFNPKTTEWKLSYDGRNKEPISLPVKFPLLLAQGAEGIAVGLSAKILPHNFGEICDAAIAYLRGQSFSLYPDFQTGGLIDVSRYNDGQRGGTIKVRARIEKRDSKTLAITELPFGKTVTSLCESIKRAEEKGRIKIRQIQDFTAERVEILIHLAPGVSSDKTIDALYAFTDCEVSVSPNCCIIDQTTPRFVSVSQVLRANVDHTMQLLQQELEIHRAELLESILFASLERIFIDERIYKDKAYENASDIEAALAHIDARLLPFKETLVRQVTHDDLLRLLEIKMARILKFNKAKADELIARMQAEIDQINQDLKKMKMVTIKWFEKIKKNYADQYPRLTEIASFATIQAATVVEANEKLYINRSTGFIGTSLKKDEFVCNCSNIDDIILFYQDGTYKVLRIAEKIYVGETERSNAQKKKAKIIHIAIFKKGDQRSIYNIVYRDGEKKWCYWKRFNVTSITYEREYLMTTDHLESEVLYFSANPNGEAETIKIKSPQLKQEFERSFADVAVKGRAVRGNLLTKLDVDRVRMVAAGVSTLGGRKVWFDQDVQRLNFDERGKYLGEFNTNDQVLVVLENGNFYTTDFDPNNHYESSGLLRIEKLDMEKVYTALLYDANNDGNLYLKRFKFERAQQTRPANFLGDNAKSRLLLLSETENPRLAIHFAAPEDFREPLLIEAQKFIDVKGYKAKGKRITTLNTSKVVELFPSEPIKEHSEHEMVEDQLNTTQAASEAAEQSISNNNSEINVLF